MSALDDTILNAEDPEQIATEYWELREEDLPEGSSFTCSKSILKDPSEGGTSSKKPKKAKTSKGDRSNNKDKQHEGRQETNATR